MTATACTQLQSEGSRPDPISSFGTVSTFLGKGTCSEALMNVLDRAFGHPMALEEYAVMPLAGGIAQHGYQCGMLWGATLAAGAQAHRQLGPGPHAETAAIVAARRLVASFGAHHEHINCLEITDTDWTSKLQMLRNFLKGGPITCVRMSVKFAPVALEQITSALSSRPVEAPPCQPSCAAMVARKLGLSHQHAVMAAGLAGGIGLSGGACGALGAAIWAHTMRHDRRASGFKDSYKEVNARANAVIERFLEASDYRFECAEIVGRRFDGVGDHARHLRDGGCSEIINALVAAAA